MRLLNPPRCAVVLAAALAASAAAAQTTPAASQRNGTTDRLFLSFAQEAAIVPSQWWEGQIEYLNGGDKLPFDALLFRGVVAFQPVKNLELGGNFGLANTNADPGIDDGTGATDLEVYGKYFFPNVSDGLDFAAGVLATIPTGDDSIGLGFNSFGAQAFGSMRYKMDSMSVGGNVGVRFNGTGRVFGADLSGKTSFQLGVNALFHLANSVTMTAEAQVETERFDGMDSVAQLVGGVDWHAWQRGQLRASLSAGLTDAAPNFTILVGYAYAF
ncbi:MAG TPA: hypothetical protein VFV19_12210 [Candidatus Polarisedimenticolaceae bacterium]|nr:hypothetical protein [Candidatus Polarisedimenticolaceae bacterium]